MECFSATFCCHQALKEQDKLERQKMNFFHVDVCTTRLKRKIENTKNVFIVFDFTLTKL